jgi:two-component system, OmpR family, sensor kinase
LLGRIKSSLVVQNNFLFSVSILFIGILWLIFYAEQKHQSEEHNLARYFNTVTTLEPLMLSNQEISDKILAIFEMEKYKGKVLTEYKTGFQKGLQSKGFRLLKFKEQNILHIYDSQKDIYLKDIHKDHDMIFTHTIFIFLVVAQIILHLKLNSSLHPLRLLSKKLKNLKEGDRTPLGVDSNYDEVKQIISAYNDSIKKIDYMLETKEMFNKIFMHEMKMPLAKGMFYLKQEPSQNTHEKLLNILNGINEELEEFSQIETLITHQNNINNTQFYFTNILEVAKDRAGLNEENIILHENIKDGKLKGDKEFWILCIKNLLDNAVKYSYNKKVTVGYEKGIYFKNNAEPLPVDISKDITQWKINKNKRHKSSTGYGFGLFIIKNIVAFHGYTLEYNYDDIKKEITLKIL